MSVTRMTPDGRPVLARRRTGGLAAGALSAATFGASGSFANALMATGWSPGAVVGIRVTLAALLLTAPAAMALRGRWVRLRRSWRTITWLGLLGVVGCQLPYYEAVRYLDVGVALLLEYSGILLVVLWMWLRHRQRPRRAVVGGGLLAVAGLIAVVQPGSGIQALGLLFGLLAAVGMAAYFVAAGRADPEIPALGLAWAGLATGAVALWVLEGLRALPFRAVTRRVPLAHTAVSWLVPVILLALVATAIAYAAGICAARLLGPRTASFVGLGEVLSGVLFAWLLVGQRPGLWQIIGGAVVLCGIAIVQANDG